MPQHRTYFVGQNMKSLTLKAFVAAVATITFTPAAFSHSEEANAQPRDFTAASNYMSRAGYLRWRYFINNNAWIGLINKNKWVSFRGEVVHLQDQKDMDDAIVELSAALARFPNSRAFQIEFNSTDDGAGALSYERLKGTLSFGGRMLQTTSEHGMMMGPVEYSDFQNLSDRDIAAKAAVILNKRKQAPPAQ